ncbi:hypothetical protein TGVAND_311170 [Toxoplasma gondii VAND]|uniref:Uncharacterized protein n=1 Tax=Toxoplasma gondii VAND TaxID=933077 RepID=A0A086QA40_TOXGO|nr:hypothetical protein TGVAND_311170 [Toxoplasma gondii VAND]
MKFICLVAVGVLPTLRTAAQRAPNGPVPYKFPERRGALAPPPPRSLSLQAATPSQPAPLTVFPRTGHALPTYFPHDDYERAKRELTEKEMKTEKTPPPCQPTAMHGQPVAGLNQRSIESSTVIHSETGPYGYVSDAPPARTKTVSLIPPPPIFPKKEAPPPLPNVRTLGEVMGGFLEKAATVLPPHH